MDKYNEISVNTLVKLVNKLMPLENECYFLLAFDKDNEDAYVMHALKSRENLITCFEKAISILSEALKDYKKEYANI